MEYEHKNHSKFLLMYHVIFVCKYRKKILGTINSELKQTIHDIEHESDFEILEMEIDKDHIHLLVKSEPKVSILAIVRKLKQETTNRLWKSQGNYLKRFYWGEKTLWSYGYFASTIGNVSKETELHAGQHRTEQYFASTIGNVSKETAAAYIRNQG